VKVYLIGMKEDNCKPLETVCPICEGSTIGDYGQPFECETCEGTGIVPLFEIHNEKEVNG
jgi:DnaJ-class molecular chaperone